MVLDWSTPTTALRTAQETAAKRLGRYDPDLETEPLEAFEHGDYSTPDLDQYDIDKSDLEPYMDVIENEEALDVRGEDVHGVFDGEQPVLLNEATAIATSLEQYSGEIEDPHDLGVQLYDHIVNETGLTDHLLEESDDDGVLHPSTVTGIYRETVVPDLEGGDGDTYPFADDRDDGWTLADDYTGEGLELLRKKRSAIGNKSAREDPHNMWRLRQVDLEDGQPMTTWKENPTATTEAVHDAAADVMDEIRETYPSTELTCFGSVEQGTMNHRSDLEHAVHLHVDDVDRMVDQDIEDTHDVDEHYMEVYSTVNRFRKQVEQAVIDATAEHGHEIKRGYGYVAVRDDEIEYPLNREKQFSEDERVLVTDGVEHIEFNDYQRKHGLTETHPSRV